jgi:hypothetical protein
MRLHPSRVNSLEGRANMPRPGRKVERRIIRGKHWTTHRSIDRRKCRGTFRPPGKRRDPLRSSALGSRRGKGVAGSDRSRLVADRLSIGSPTCPQLTPAERSLCKSLRARQTRFTGRVETGRRERGRVTDEFHRGQDGDGSGHVPRPDIGHWLRVPADGVPASIFAGLMLAHDEPGPEVRDAQAG